MRRKKMVVALLGLVLLVMVLVPNIYWASETVIQVSTPEQLADVATQVQNGNNFARTTIELTANIDLSGYPNWTPIGTLDIRGRRIVPFSGTFEGNNHTITGLTINDTREKEGVGLFGVVEGATIRNLTLETSSVGINAKRNAAALVGQIRDSSNGQSTEIVNIHVFGSVYATGKNSGLLVGNINLRRNNASLLIDNCTVEGRVHSQQRHVGGAIGRAHFSSSRGDFRITNSSSNVEVRARKSYVGGFIGKLYNTERGVSVLIDNCQSIGSVASQRSFTGGFAGMVKGVTIQNSMADTTIRFFNFEGGDVDDEIDDDNHEDESDDDDVEDDDERVDPDSIEAQRSHVGGFVGRVRGRSRNRTRIINSYATSDIIGGRKYVGGFIGRGSHAIIERCWATGHVSATRRHVGGFAGRLFKSNVSESYATGYATSRGRGVGGFVGSTGGSGSTISNSFAVGGASSTGDNRNRVGAFGGSIRRTHISNSYASGRVFGGGRSSSYAGAFLGWSGTNVRLTDCIYDSTTTGILPAIGRERARVSGTAVGVPTERMIRRSTFPASWSLGNGGIWDIVCGETYPFLQHQWDNEWSNTYHVAAITDSTGRQYSLPEGMLNNGQLFITNVNADRLYFPYGPTRVLFLPDRLITTSVNISPDVKYAIGVFSESNIVAFIYGECIHEVEISVYTGDPIDITMESATIENNMFTIDINDLEYIGSVGIEIASEYTTTEKVLAPTVETPFQVNLTDLTPDTVYQYRAFVRDSVLYHYGEWKSFRTLEIDKFNDELINDSNLDSDSSSDNEFVSDNNLDNNTDDELINYENDVFFDNSDLAD